MKRTFGFTLIELLVVIAIIGILAAIVVPRVSDYIVKARAGKAVSEIRGVELALTKMLTDAEKNNFAHFFTNATINELREPLKNALDNEDGSVANTQQFFAAQIRAQEFYTHAMYILLRKGKKAGEDLGNAVNPDVIKKLADSYMSLDKDPWDQLYHFYLGPLRGHPTTNPFRIYSPNIDVPGGPSVDNIAPTPADVDGKRIGYFAPSDLPVYIYSLGADLISAQRMYWNSTDDADGDGYSDGLEDNAKGGGDDINNWDTSGSWNAFYK